jgi:hypothetical protein
VTALESNTMPLHAVCRLRLSGLMLRRKARLNESSPLAYATIMVLDNAAQRVN